MSQYSIQQLLGNASVVEVSPINTDATLSTSVALNNSLWAGIGVSARGKPFNVLVVTESNYEDVIGKPLKPSSGSQFEPIRHVYEAVQQTSRYVVRAVPDDTNFPIVMFDESGDLTRCGYDPRDTYCVFGGRNERLHGPLMLSVYSSGSPL